MPVDIRKNLFGVALSNSITGPKLTALQQDRWLADYERVAIFLRDGKGAALQTALAALEAAFHGAGASKKGVLTGLLAAKEQQGGFERLKTGRDVPTLVGFVPPDSFNEDLLNQQLHFKDVGAGARHGEFTHRIQWWLVMEANVIQGGRAADLFRALAAYPARNLDGLWDAIFDRIRKGNAGFMAEDEDPFDFRCPEVFNDHLRKRSGSLGPWLEGRFQKRSKLGSGDLLGKNYLARHHYQKDYARLDPPLRKIIDELASDPMVTDRLPPRSPPPADT